MVDAKKKTKKKSHKHAKNLVLSIDRNKKIIKFNEKCEKTFGYSRETILNKPFFDTIVPKKYLNQWQKIFNSAIKKCKIDDFKLPILTKNGHEIMLSCSSFPLKDEKGQPKDVNIVGNLISSWNDSEDSIVLGWEEPVNKSNMQWKEVSEKPEFKESRPKSDAKKNEILLKEILRKYNLLKKENSYLKKYIGKIKNPNLGEDSSKKDLFGKNVYKVSNIFGSKKRREEINSLMNELDAREEYLEKLHLLIKKDKEKINKERKGLIEWRRKLELLESEIESRRKWVVNKEKTLEKYYDSDFKEHLDGIVKNEEKLEPNMINKIKNSAAIIQRGVFKQVNNSFANLLGYNPEEIVNKSLFDFIVSDGFSNIENYYLHRLKGDEVSSINTVFLTKDSNKLNVEVSTKPTVFNEEKADLFVVKSKNLNDNEGVIETTNIDEAGSDINPENEKNDIYSRIKDRRENTAEEDKESKKSSLDIGDNYSSKTDDDNKSKKDKKNS